MFLFFIGAKVRRNIGFQAEEWGFFLNIALQKSGFPQLYFRKIWLDSETKNRLWATKIQKD